MNASALQSLLLALILAISAVAALRHLLPQAFRRVQGGMARVLSRPRHHRFIRRLGLWLQPEEARQGGCGSGLGCAQCAGCSASAAETTPAIPLKFSQPPARGPA